MNNWLLFLLKSTISISLLYLFFRLLMRKESFFKLSRMTLLFIVLTSTIIPFITLPQPIYSGLPIKVAPFFQNNAIIEKTAQPIGIPAAINSTEPSSDTLQPIVISTKTILLVVYLAGVFISLLLLFFRISSVLLLFRKSRKTVLNGIRIMIVNDDIPAFSFKRHILISQQDYETNSKAILTHELSHINQGHFYDLFLMEMVKIIYWFNPLVYRIDSDMKEIHEFQADEHTLNSGIDATKYQLLIIQKCVGHKQFALANSFNHCQIKNRITMINKTKTNKAWCWKVATFLPLLALLLMAFGKRGEIVPEKIMLPEKILAQTLNFQKQDSTSHNMFTDKVTGKTAFVLADVMPRYPGGDHELLNFISRNIQYPEKALAEKIEGKVIIRFIVTKEGKTDNVTVIKGIHTLLDAESVRIANMLTGWKPGMNNGKAVDVWYVIPVKFELPGKPN
jgi:TonB family protein